MMKATLAAALIFVASQAAAQACEEAPAADAPPTTATSVLLASAKLPETMMRTATDAPGMSLAGGTPAATALVRTGGPRDGVARFAPQDGPGPAAASAESTESRVSDHSGKLLLLGLALMAGIALRRWRMGSR